MVMDMFARNLGVKVIHVDAEEQFMAKLAGVTDPEKKTQNHRRGIYRSI